MLCWGLWGVLSQFPALSWLKMCLSSSPGEQQLRAGAGCAVLPAWSTDPAGICRVVTAQGQGGEQGCVCPQDLCSL